MFSYSPTDICHQVLDLYSQQPSRTDSPQGPNSQVQNAAPVPPKVAPAVALPVTTPTKPAAGVARPGGGFDQRLDAMQPKVEVAAAVGYVNYAMGVTNSVVVPPPNMNINVAPPLPVQHALPPGVPPQHTFPPYTGYGMMPPGNPPVPPVPPQAYPPPPLPPTQMPYYGAPYGAFPGQYPPVPPGVPQPPPPPRPY